MFECRKVAVDVSPVCAFVYSIPKGFSIGGAVGKLFDWVCKSYWCTIHCNWCPLCKDTFLYICTWWLLISSCLYIDKLNLVVKSVLSSLILFPHQKVLYILSKWDARILVELFGPNRANLYMQRGTQAMLPEGGNHSTRFRGWLMQDVSITMDFFHLPKVDRQHPLWWSIAIAHCKGYWSPSTTQFWPFWTLIVELLSSKNQHEICKGIRLAGFMTVLESQSSHVTFWPRTEKAHVTVWIALYCIMKPVLVILLHTWQIQKWIVSFIQWNWPGVQICLSAWFRSDILGWLHTDTSTHSVRVRTVQVAVSFPYVNAIYYIIYIYIHDIWMEYFIYLGNHHFSKFALCLSSLPHQSPVAMRTWLGANARRCGKGPDP